MKCKHYAIKVVCKQVLDQDGFSLMEEGEVVFLVEDEYGHSTCSESWLHYSTLLTYETYEQADGVARRLTKHLNPWYVEAKSYEIVEVKPIYETKIVGWEIK